MIKELGAVEDMARPDNRTCRGGDEILLLSLLEEQVKAGVPLDGVTLYGLARPSMQPGAERLGRVSPEWLEALAERVRAATGLPVAVHP